MVNPQFVNILLAHGTLDMDFDRNAYNQMESKKLDTLDMDYIALGHFHKKFEAKGKRGTIYNPGSPEPLGFDELGSHGVFLGTIIKQDNGQSSLDVRFVQMNKRCYEIIEIYVNGCNNDAQVISEISEKIKEKNPHNTLFNVVLKGYIEPGYSINTFYIVEHFKDRVFFIKLEDQTRPDYDFELIKREPGLKGLFSREMLSLIDRTDRAEQKEIYLKALYYGLEALDNGRINISG